MKRLFVLVLMLLLGLLPVSAQELTETFSFENGVSFDYPANAEVQREDDTLDLAIVALEAGGEIWVASPSFIADEAKLDDNAGLADVMAWWLAFIFGVEFDFEEDAFRATKVGDLKALSFAYEGDDDTAGFSVVVQFGDGTFGAVDGFGSAETIEDLTLAVAESFGPGEADARGGEPCIVSTTNANTVQLRVGPGINRTVYAFLPANIDFTPLGRSEADDGSGWFQLDKAEAAPNAAAAEAWIAVDAVNTEGDCEAIGEASAPPIIPIVPQAPPPSSDSGSSGNGETSSGGSTVSALPGTWTITYGARGKASCLDIEGTFDFSPGWTPDVVNLSVAGRTVIMDGNRFNQIQPGLFSGIFTLSNGNALQFLIRQASPTQFTGEALLTGVVDGHTCSNTVPLSISRN